MGNTAWCLGPPSSWTLRLCAVLLPSCPQERAEAQGGRPHWPWPAHFIVLWTPPSSGSTSGKGCASLSPQGAQGTGGGTAWGSQSGSHSSGHRADLSARQPLALPGACVCAHNRSCCFCSLPGPCKGLEAFPPSILTTSQGGGLCREERETPGIKTLSRFSWLVIRDSTARI